MLMHNHSERDAAQKRPVMPYPIVRPNLLKV